MTLPGADAVLEYVVRYPTARRRPGPGRSRTVAGAARGGLPLHRARVHPPFLTPDWAKDGVIYQIFPERFRNGDPANDPDFTEAWYYQGANKLPACGKLNTDQRRVLPPGRDWYDVGGAGAQTPTAPTASPTTTRSTAATSPACAQKLDYLKDLGVTVIYFNPLNQAMSNHKYDPVDYTRSTRTSPTNAEFKAFVKDGARPRHPHRGGHGLQPLGQLALTPSGRGREGHAESQYYNWYEFKRWPLPDSPDVHPEAGRLLRLLVGLRAAPEPELRPLAHPTAPKHIQDVSDAQAQHRRSSTTC